MQGCAAVWRVAPSHRDGYAARVARTLARARQRCFDVRVGGAGGGADLDVAVAADLEDEAGAPPGSRRLPAGVTGLRPSRWFALAPVRRASQGTGRSRRR